MKLKHLLAIGAVLILLSGCTAKNDKLFKKAILLNKEGKVQSALQVYNTILRDDVNYYSAIANRAIIYEKMGLFDKAEDDYLRALALYPNQPEVLNNLGAFYISQKKPFSAISYLDRAIDLRPNYYLALVNRSAANQYLGYLRVALDDISLAVEIMPQAPLAVTNKAIIDYQLFNYEDAVLGYSKVINSEPTNAKNYYRRGMAFRMWNKYANALQDFDTAVHINPNYVPALYARAEMLFKSGDYQAALGDLDRLKTINNEYVPAYELAGDIVAIEDPIAAAANYLVCKKLDKTPKNQKRYNAKIALMASDKGREKVITRTFNDK